MDVNVEVIIEFRVSLEVWMVGRLRVDQEDT